MTITHLIAFALGFITGAVTILALLVIRAVKRGADSLAGVVSDIRSNADDVPVSRGERKRKVKVMRW